jgi:steroid 5-alpha reductase family enzyme
MGILAQSVAAALPYLSGLLLGTFIVAVLRKNNGVMDIAWGIGFIVTAVASIVHIPHPYWRAYFVTFLVCLWGVRHAYRIGRIAWGRSEDFRYATWRASWGKWFYVRSFFQIYVLQGWLLMIIILPVFAAQYTHTGFAILDVIGGAVWLIGFYFEARGDYELDEFLSNPINKGKLMTLGLWSLTRHPNYFGEACMWWGIGIIGLAAGFPGMIALAGPLLITYLLLRVSGVPLVEAHMQTHPDFPAYRARTNMFIPSLPKRQGGDN